MYLGGEFKLLLYRLAFWDGTLKFCSEIIQQIFFFEDFFFDIRIFGLPRIRLCYNFLYALCNIFHFLIRLRIRKFVMRSEKIFSGNLQIFKVITKFQNFLIHTIFKNKNDKYFFVYNFMIFISFFDFLFRIPIFGIPFFYFQF